MHEGFDFWVDDADELDAEGKDSLERANAVGHPDRASCTRPTSAYWCRIGERTHLRWVLPHDEDAATDALARLHAARRQRARRRAPGCSGRSAPAGCSSRSGSWTRR